MGAERELGLNVGARYSIVALLFFPPYILLELPSQMLFQRVEPRKFMGFIIMGWGRKSKLPPFPFPMNNYPPANQNT